MKAPKFIFIIIFTLGLFPEMNHFCFAQEDVTMQASAIVGAAIGLYDIVTAPLAAKSHNQQFSTFGLNFSRDVLVSRSNRSATYAPRQSVKARKSPALALLISLFATGIPTGLGLIYLEKEKHETAAVAILSIGAVMGPSTGHLYAKKYRRGFLTAGLRLIMWSLFIKKVTEIEYS